MFDYMVLSSFYGFVSGVAFLFTLFQFGCGKKEWAGAAFVTIVTSLVAIRYAILATV